LAPVLGFCFYRNVQGKCGVRISRFFPDPHGMDAGRGCGLFFGIFGGGWGIGFTLRKIASRNAKGQVPPVVRILLAVMCMAGLALCAFLDVGVIVFVIGRGWRGRVVFIPMMVLHCGMLRQETQPGKYRRYPVFTLL
jgi:hypothetical protein